MRGWRGTLLKEWTITTTLAAASGLPETPIYETNVAGTGIVGTIRPDTTGASLKAASAGKFLNQGAFTTPQTGQWGDAGRNSITGPAQWSFNASLGRTFRLNSRLTADWRMDAFNVLNAVTFTNYNVLWSPTSTVFGEPTAANTMRKLQTTFRVRF